MNLRTVKLCVFVWLVTTGTHLIAIESEDTRQAESAGKESDSPAVPTGVPIQNISSLSVKQTGIQTNAFVHVQGTVLDQRPGEYFVIRDETGTLNAETHLTVLPGIKEQVDVWGSPVWDGVRVHLENAIFRSAINPTLIQEISVPSIKPDRLPILTNAWEVRDLSAERAAWKYPVHLRAVVTVNARRDESFFAQDETSGIYIRTQNRLDVKPGDLVEIEGVSNPGGFAPIVQASTVSVIGTASLPEARLVTLFQLATGQDGSQWIEVRGVIRSLIYTNGVVKLNLSDPSGTLRVNIPADAEPKNLIDAIVRIKGVCGSEANSRRQLTVLQMWANSMNYLQIEEPGNPDPLSQPPQPIVSLSQFRPRQTLQHRVTVTGVVTLAEPGQSFFIQSGGDGIQVLTAQKDEVKPGDQVLAAGYPALGDFRSVLRDAVFRVVRHGTVPKPQMLSPSHALDAQWQDRLVQIKARLSTSSQIGARQVLTLQFGDRIFEAHCLVPLATLTNIPADSVLQLTGVYRILADEARVPSSFQLIVPSGESIHVMAQPSWWNFRHTVYVLGALAVTFAATVLWIVMLRRKVRQQTGSLQQSESKFRLLVEKSLVGVYIIQDGHFTYINPRLAEIFGYTPDELLSRPIKDFIFPEDLSLVEEQYRRRIAGEISTAHYDFRGQRKDGTLYHVEVLGSVTTVHGKPAILGTALDITERKRAEEELFRSRQMLRTVLDTIPQRVFWKDRNLNYAGGNQAFAEDCGFTDPAEIIGRTDYDTRSAEMAELYRADDRQVLETGQPKLNYEEPQLGSEGTRKWLKTSKVPLFDKNGEITGVLGTYEDVTEHKRAEVALAEASSLLETMLANCPDYIYFKDRESRFVRASKSLATVFNVSSPDELTGKTDFDFFLDDHARQAFEDEQRIIRTGESIVGKPEKETHVDGRTTWALTTKLPWRDKDGNIIGTFGISKDVTVAKEIEQKLEYERELFHALVNNLPDAIYFKDRESRFVRLSRSKVERSRQILLSSHQAKHGSAPPPDYLASIEKCSEYLLGMTDFDVYTEDRARAAFEEEQTIIRTNEPIVGKLDKTLKPDGSAAWYLSTKMPWRDEHGNIIGTFGVSADVTALKEAEAQLEEAHKRLIETSRLAGMAEVATDVLHNVGNVLNSVNVSCSISMDRIRSLKVPSLAKVSSLLNENRTRLPEFFSGDTRGQQIPDYLTALAEHMATDQATILKEFDQLLKHVDHIKQIVAMQQTYAKVAGIKENVDPVQLVEDALNINAAALTRHVVTVQREFQDMPPLTTEKHKVMQILVNLIRNAKYALDESGRPERLLCVKVGSDGNGCVKIEVKDNGVGIPTENLTRIFGHGFTTRHDGHGFGLHSSAIAVRELGGSLHAQSEGPGMGATFTLLLPYKPINQTEQTV